MARPPKLRVRDGQYYTEAGGRGAYLGRVDRIDRDEALRRFHAHLAAVGRGPGGADGITVRDLAARYIAWMMDHRARSNWYNRQVHLNRLVDRDGDTEAARLDPARLRAIVAEVARECSPGYARHVHDTYRAMFRWARGEAILPDAVDPMRHVRVPEVDARAVSEDELPTRAEVVALLGRATGPLRDFLVLLHDTGARPGELMRARRSDVQQGTQQIVLRRHKRSHALHDARVIQLGRAGQQVVREVMAQPLGDVAGDFLLVRECGRPWHTIALGRMFRVLRRRAEVRERIVPYSLRHLWISEALMAGVDVMLVARMAGTSVAMIDRVYAHFRNQSYVDALARLGEFRSATASRGC